MREMFRYGGYCTLLEDKKRTFCHFCHFLPHFATCTCNDSQRYWQLYRVRPSRMGAYLTTALNADPNPVKYCINTAKMVYIADTPIFLGMF